MNLFYKFYETESRKGLLLFHQKSGFANGGELIHRIFETFIVNFREIVKDKESTKIRSISDLNEVEIQNVESAKVRALKSMPNSPLYWGNDIYNIHIDNEFIYAKLPAWFQAQSLESSEFYQIPCKGIWAKLEKKKMNGLFCSLLDIQDRKSHLVGAGTGSYRISSLLCKPVLESQPCFSFSWGDQ